MRFNANYSGTALSLVADATAGDANLDGVIDTEDFVILATHFAQAGQNWLTADFNHDGVVNALDFNAIAANFGSVAISAPLPLGTNVPEPFGAGLFLLGLVVRRRRKGCRRKHN